MQTTRRKLLAGIGAGIATAVAGCAANAAEPDEPASEAAAGSDLVDAIEVADGTLSIAFESDPVVEGQDCWFNPATKTTMCDYPDVNVTPVRARLLDGEDEELAARDIDAGSVQFDLPGDGQYAVAVDVKSDNHGDATVRISLSVGDAVRAGIEEQTIEL